MGRLARRRRWQAAVTMLATALPVYGYAQAPVTIVPAAPGVNPAERLSEPVRVRYTSRIGFLPSDPALGGSYPRVVELKAYPRARGDLLATFARRGTMPVFRSRDHGETWELASELPELRGEPTLLELPRAVGAFPAGTVLLAGSATGDPAPERRRLLLFASGDGGGSWRPVSTIAESPPGRYDPIDRAGLSDQSPVYEPFLYLDARGELVAAYSNEGFKREGYSQLIEHKVSPDGGRSWGRPCAMWRWPMA